MVAGRNYDYGTIFSELEDDVLVTIFNPADESLSTAIVGYAGEIYAVNGMNEARARSYEWCPIGVKRAEDDNPEGLLVSTNHYNDPGWELEKPTDESSWQSLARRDSLIRLCEKEKGNVDACNDWCSCMPHFFRG